jgi:hypothetical protein
MMTFAGQRLTDAQVQELVVMMTLAAEGAGPTTATAPQGSGLADVVSQLARARADQAKLAAAQQRFFASPTALHAIVSDPSTYHWDFAANAMMPNARAPVQAAPYTGPSMSDTGVGPNPTWAEGQIQPYAQPSGGGQPAFFQPAVDPWTGLPTAIDPNAGLPGHGGPGT